MPDTDRKLVASSPPVRFKKDGAYLRKSVVGPPGFEPGISAVLICHQCEGGVLTSWTTGPDRASRTNLPQHTLEAYGIRQVYLKVFDYATGSVRRFGRKTRAIAF